MGTEGRYAKEKKKIKLRTWSEWEVNCGMSHLSAEEISSDGELHKPLHPSSLYAWLFPFFLALEQRAGPPSFGPTRVKTLQ